MLKDKQRYLIEDISQKFVDLRSLEERRFFIWHLKFKMPFFKQYPYEQLSALTEKFSYHPEGKLTEAQKANPTDNYAFFPIYKAIKIFKDIITPHAHEGFDFEQVIPQCLILKKTEYQNAVYDFKMNQKTKRFNFLQTV
jgi:hypothetical protein